MRLLPLCLAITLLTAPFAKAETPTAHLELTYETYSAGVPVAAMTAALHIDPTSYRLGFTFHTTGLIGLLFDSRSDSTAEGTFTPGIRPSLYQSHSTVRGTARETRIEYQGGHPVVTLLTPADDEPRDPVPASQQANSLDGLSTIVHMLREVARTGRCDDQRMVFDGRRLLKLQSTTGGEETIETSSRSPWSGPALRCDITSQQIAGFLKGADRGAAQKLRHTTAWLQPIGDGGMVMPVRIDVETAWVGVAHVYLTGMKTGGA